MQTVIHWTIIIEAVGIGNLIIQFTSSNCRT